MSAPHITALAVGLVLALTSGASAGAGAASPASQTRPIAAINGSFLQPWIIDDLSDQQLAQGASYLRRAGLTQQVLQWTADSGTKTAVFPSGIPGYTQSTSTDVLERTLSAADKAGLTEYVGLQISDEWWTELAQDTTWLTSQAAFANQLADRIWARYGSHASFGGWYLAFEVDNWNFTTQASWAALANFYTTVANHLHAITPGMPVIISPFYNPAGGLTSAQWTAMWTYILRNAPIDVIALQDGFGAGHATTAQLAEWFSATASAIAAARVSTQLWDNVETYTLPANSLDISTVVANMNQVKPYVTNILSFSYDHYDSPLLVDPAYDLTYRQYLRTGRVETTPPSAPSDLVASVVDAQTVKLTWNASTDNIGVVGYRVFRNGALLDTIHGTATSFTDTALPHLASASYFVAAFDAAGNVSGDSRSASVILSSSLADHAPYTASLAADPWYPDSGKELTDGVFGTPTYTDPAWQGRSTPSPYSFTVDLGTTRTVEEIHSNWLQAQAAYIFLPAKLEVETSADGKTFTPAGIIMAPAVSPADQSAEYRLTGLNVSARYVRVTVTPASYIWTFTDELEVLGN